MARYSFKIQEPHPTTTPTAHSTIVSYPIVSLSQHPPNHHIHQPCKMPTIAGRRGDCHSCRRMKVKCDERKPGCYRCEKAGRQCPGYREEIDNFRSMTESVETKAQEAERRRRKSREPPTPPTSGSLPEERPIVKVDKSAASSSSKAPRRSPSVGQRQGLLAPPMSTDWDTQAIHQFFENFVIQADASRSSPGFLDFLPELYLEQTTDNCLSDAVKAVAFMYLSKRSSIQSFAVQARRSYGKALVQASSNLNIHEEAKSDHMLATLAILDLYEVWLTNIGPIQDKLSNDIVDMRRKITS